MTTAIIAAIFLGLIFGFMAGVVAGLKLANDVLGIPKGYKVDKVTFKKIQKAE